MVLEGGVVLGYCRWRQKTWAPLLLTSIVANLVTQAGLWIALCLLFQHYLAVLLVSEVLIWASESLMLWSVSANRLSLREAMWLSLLMNGTSFGLGCWLPV